jgi:hypothetical protein
MTKILTIGNSFSVNATSYMDELMEAEPSADLFLGEMVLGGCSLEKHWNLVEQCDLLPEVKPYNFGRTGREPVKATLREALAAEQWDFVTLQQASPLSHDRDTYEPSFGNLHALIGDIASQARPVIHMTWAYRIDSRLLAEWEITQGEMFQRLRKNYREMAEKYDCPILPVGEAFQKARAKLDYRVDEHFDRENAKPFDLPDQTGSLNVGWQWTTGNTRSGKATLWMDEKHANSKGCYLANAVWYELFTGKSIADNSFRPEGVSDEELGILQAAAHEAVEEYGGTLVGRHHGVRPEELRQDDRAGRTLS